MITLYFPKLEVDSKVVIFNGNILHAKVGGNPSDFFREFDIRYRIVLSSRTSRFDVFLTFGRGPLEAFQMQLELVLLCQIAVAF